METIYGERRIVTNVETKVRKNITENKELVTYQKKHRRPLHDEANQRAPKIVKVNQYIHKNIVVRHWARTVKQNE